MVFAGTGPEDAVHAKGESAPVRHPGIPRLPRAVEPGTLRCRKPTVHVAYLVNQYPKVSHTFIRREIQALEQLGVGVSRISVRGVEDLQDPADRAEQTKTHVLLRNKGKLATAALRTLIGSPLRSLNALRTAWRCGRTSVRGVGGWLAYWVEAAALRTLLADRGVRHVHAHFGTNPAAVAMLCRLLGGPTYSFTLHGPDEFDGPRELHLGKKVEHASFVAVISHFALGQLARWIRPQDIDKLAIVRCGLDPTYFTAPPRPATPPPRFVCIARLAPEKGHWFLLQAAAELWRSGQRFELVLAGDGPLRALLEQQIRDQGLGDCVRITGWIDNQQVRELLHGSRTLVSASLAEGLPVVMMEAFAMRVPVIATSIAAVGELVEHGQSGWVVNSSDSTALATAMAEALAAEPAELARRGEHGHRRCLHQHDVLRAAGVLRERFTKVLGTATDPVQAPRP